MTTPAQNTNVNYALNQTIFRWINGSPVSSLVASGFSGSDVHIRPASGASPVRADGSRAPRAWSNRWFTGGSFNRNLVWTNTAGSNLVRYEGLLNIADVVSDRVFNGTGATWCRTTSPTIFPLSVENRARTKFLLELGQNKAQLGQMLAEIAQTGRMIGSLASDVVGGVDRISKRVGLLREDAARLLTGKKLRKMPKSEFLKIKRLAPELIARWLELQFGLRPLFSDIEDSGAVLSDLIFVEGREAKFSVRKGYSTIERVTASFTGNSTSGWRVYQPYLVETSCHISGIYKIPVTAERTFSQLGLSNSFSVAWETLLLSWMVDYLTTTGQWLETLTAAQGTTYVEGSISRMQRVSPAGRFNIEPWDSNIKLITGFGPGMLTTQGGKFERQLLPAGVHPGYYPSARNRMGLDQMANSLAALASMAGGTHQKLRI